MTEKTKKRGMSYTINYQNIGGNILRALEKRNKTQTWLAEEIGVDKTHVNKWVKNKVRPGSKYLDRICRALDYKAEEIITGMFEDERTYKKPSYETVEEPEAIYDGELQLIETYIDTIINSEKREVKIGYKKRLLSLIETIIVQ